MGKRFSAGKRHAVEVSHGVDFRPQFTYGRWCAAGRIVREGIVSSGTVVRASLHEDHKADPRSVYDGFGNGSVQAQGQIMDSADRFRTEGISSGLMESHRLPPWSLFEGYRQIYHYTLLYRKTDGKSTEIA